MLSYHLVIYNFIFCYLDFITELTNAINYLFIEADWQKREITQLEK